MPTIQVIDWLGDYWDISFGQWVIKDETALCEAFHYVNEGPDWVEGYDMIPLPLFVEWWI